MGERENVIKLLSEKSEGLTQRQIMPLTSYWVKDTFVCERYTRTVLSGKLRGKLKGC